MPPRWLIIDRLDDRDFLRMTRERHSVDMGRGEYRERSSLMRKRRRQVPTDVFPTEAEIAQRAYELCFVARRLCVDHRGYLHLAEQELLDRGARRALRNTNSRRQP